VFNDIAQVNTATHIIMQNLMHLIIAIVNYQAKFKSDHTHLTNQAMHKYLYSIYTIY